jgi:hypothetical protein
MNIFKRFVYLLLIIAAILLAPIEAFFLLLRWVFTGKNFACYPLFVYLIAGEFTWSEYLNDEF